MSDREELKPCPFCGSEAHVTGGHGRFRIECTERFDSCPVNMRTHHHNLESEAAAAWNTRAALRSHQEMKEALEEVEATATRAQSFYDRNGPELTSTASGAELYEASTFLAAHEAYAEIARTTLETLKQKDEG